LDIEIDFDPDVREDVFYPNRNPIYDNDILIYIDGKEIDYDDIQNENVKEYVCQVIEYRLLQSFYKFFEETKHYWLKDPEDARYSALQWMSISCWKVQCKYKFRIMYNPLPDTNRCLVAMGELFCQDLSWVKMENI